MKKCSRCGIDKELSEFGKHKAGKYGLRSSCKMCVATYSRSRYLSDPTRVQGNARRWREKNIERAHQVQKAAIFRRFNMTEQDYDRILRAQGGRCAICSSDDPGSARFNIDHDHACCPGNYSCGNCVRGLLCRRCNLGLGNLRDSLDLLEKAQAYLQGGLRRWVGV